MMKHVYSKCSQQARGIEQLARAQAATHPYSAAWMRTPVQSFLR
jgi:hypothetical protein